MAFPYDSNYGCISLWSRYHRTGDYSTSKRSPYSTGCGIWPKAWQYKVTQRCCRPCSFFIISLAMHSWASKQSCCSLLWRTQSAGKSVDTYAYAFACRTSIHSRIRVLSLSSWCLTWALFDASTNDDLSMLPVPVKISSHLAPESCVVKTSSMMNDRL